MAVKFEKFTLADIRTSVRGKLDDAEYPATDIDEAANDFQYEIFNDNRIGFMEKSKVITVGSGNTHVDFPDDFQTMLNWIVYDSSTQYRNLKKLFREYGDFMRVYPNFAINNADKLYEWTEFGFGARFANPADAAYQTLLDYLRIPALMEEDTDECEVPRTYKEMMVLGTLARVMEREEDYAEGAQERNKLQSLRTSFVRNYGRGAVKVGPTIMRTNRRIGRGRGNVGLEK